MTLGHAEGVGGLEPLPLMKSDAELAEILTLLEQLDERRRFHAIEFFRAYPKQQTFFDLGLVKRERMLKAGNQQGKTEAGAAEMVYHLTGEYPADWLGQRYERPIKSWAAGVTSQVVRDVMQRKLCGEPGIEDAFGTGLIPKDQLKSKTLGRSVTDGYDSINVEHRTNGKVDGLSRLLFKSYEQGKGKFQSDTVDVLWLDEEPPMEIYSECLARITAVRDGRLYVTFTPLSGKTALVSRFMDEPSPDREVVTMTIYDAEHIAAEDRQRIIDGYPSHEREARAMGVPMLGSGRIFPYSDDMISEPPLTYIPNHWFKGWGIDFGIGHPFAAVLMLWDKDNDVIHVHSAIRMADSLPLQHAAAMKPIGADVPVSWPHDGDSREKSSGTTLASAYKAQGLRMQPSHATFPDGGYDTEAGLLELNSRITTGRFKVAAHLAMWFEEYREYHRKDGMIVKVKDDLLSATRIGVMDRRNWKLCLLGGKRPQRRGDGMARGLDFDVFTGA